MKKILDFLTLLKENNDREWFLANKKEYESAKAELLILIETLIQGLGKLDPRMASLEPKKCIFRINRDIRFSKNKSPYKSNMGAYFSAEGKKSNLAGYYLHIEPGNCFVAGGCYGPEAPILKAIRQEIDYNLKDLKTILKEKSFAKNFGELEQTMKTKTMPKGYAADNEAAEFLRLKSFVATKNINEKTMLSKDVSTEILEAFQSVNPLIEFLNEAITNSENND